MNKRTAGKVMTIYGVVCSNGTKVKRNIAADLIKFILTLNCGMSTIVTETSLLIHVVVRIRFALIELQVQQSL